MLVFVNFKIFIRHFSFILLLLLGSHAYAVAFSAVVIKVSDGDTLHVKETNGVITKIRLYGIDCPETAQPYGKSAAKFTENYALNRKVNVKAIETDQYGRLVAIVTVKSEQTSLNMQLIRQGYAWYYPQFCRSGDFCKTIKNLELEARKQKLGLWREVNPIPPWEYRKNFTKQKDYDADYDWEENVAEITAFLKHFFRMVKAFLFNITELLAGN